MRNSDVTKMLSMGVINSSSEVNKDSVNCCVKQSVEKMKEFIPLCGEKKLKRCLGSLTSHFKKMGIVYEETDTINLEDNYVRVINDCLSDLNSKSKNTYVYSLTQVAEILRFRRDIDITYDYNSGAYEIKVVSE